MVSPRRFDPERHRALTEGKVKKEREIAALRHGAVGVETCTHTAHTHRTASATSTAPHARSAGHRGCAPIAPPTASHSRSVACRVTPSVGDRVSSMTFDPAGHRVSRYKSYAFGRPSLLHEREAPPAARGKESVGGHAALPRCTPLAKPQGRTGHCVDVSADASLKSTQLMKPPPPILAAGLCSTPLT